MILPPTSQLICKIPIEANSLATFPQSKGKQALLFFTLGLCLFLSCSSRTVSYTLYPQLGKPTPLQCPCQYTCDCGYSSFPGLVQRQHELAELLSLERDAAWGSREHRHWMGISFQEEEKGLSYSQAVPSSQFTQGKKCNFCRSKIWR